MGHILWGKTQEYERKHKLCLSDTVACVLFRPPFHFYFGEVLKRPWQRRWRIVARAFRFIQDKERRFSRRKQGRGWRNKVLFLQTRVRISYFWNKSEVLLGFGFIFLKSTSSLKYSFNICKFCSCKVSQKRIDCFKNWVTRKWWPFL